MFAKQYVAEIQQLGKTLRKTHQRLREESDEEALHDLRITVRRLRSLLAPLRSQQESQSLREAAAAVSRLTTPARDLEVLIEELVRRDQPEQAEVRSLQLQTYYQQIIAAPELEALRDELDRWPAAFLTSILGNQPKQLKPLIDKALAKQLKRLQAALQDEDFDRHRLRILVKRTRYLTDAFPELSRLSKPATKALKKAQGALGSWHDHHQWCLKAQCCKDLSPLKKQWTAASAEELHEAENALSKLAKRLPKADFRKNRS